MHMGSIFLLWFKFGPFSFHILLESQKMVWFFPPEAGFTLTDNTYFCGT